MAARDLELGPTGETVRGNISRLRRARGLSFADLSRRLEKTGRPIPASGLRRIEAGDRRVDVDDLVAIAWVLWADVPTLLFPDVMDEKEQVSITGVGAFGGAAAPWRWLTSAGVVPFTSLFGEEQFSDAMAAWVRSRPRIAAPPELPPGVTEEGVSDTDA